MGVASISSRVWPAKIILPEAARRILVRAASMLFPGKSEKYVTIEKVLLNIELYSAKLAPADHGCYGFGP